MDFKLHFFFTHVMHADPAAKSSVPPKATLIMQPLPSVTTAMGSQYIWGPGQTRWPSKTNLKLNFTKSLLPRTFFVAIILRLCVIFFNDLTTEMEVMDEGNLTILHKYMRFGRLSCIVTALGSANNHTILLPCFIHIGRQWGRHHRQKRWAEINFKLNFMLSYCIVDITTCQLVYEQGYELQNSYLGNTQAQCFHCLFWFLTPDYFLPHKYSHYSEKIQQHVYLYKWLLFLPNWLNFSSFSEISIILFHQ